MLGNGALHKNKLHVTAFGGFRHVVVMYENLGFKYNLEHHVPDFIVSGKEIKFGKEFRTLTSEDSFCDVPVAVFERARSLLTVELVDSVAKTVHDTVVFDLGCSRVPLFSLETGDETDASSSRDAFSSGVLRSLKCASFQASSR